MKINDVTRGRRDMVPHRQLHSQAAQGRMGYVVLSLHTIINYQLIIIV